MRRSSAGPGYRRRGAPTTVAVHICEWKSTIKDVTFDIAADAYSFKLENTFTVRCAEGIGLTDIKLEIRDGSVFAPPITSDTLA